MGKKEGCNKMSKKTHFVTAPFLAASSQRLADSFKSTSQTAFGGQLPYYGSLEDCLYELLATNC